MNLNLNTLQPGAKHLSYFHFYLGTISTLSPSSLELISPTCLCYAAVITLNLKAGVSRLSLGEINRKISTNNRCVHYWLVGKCSGGILVAKEKHGYAVIKQLR